MNAFAPLLLPLFAGLVLTAFFTRSSALGRRPLFIAALAGPAGLGAVSLLIFAAYTLHPASAMALVFAALLAGFAWLLTKAPGVREFPFSFNAKACKTFFNEKPALAVVRLLALLLFLFQLAVFIKTFLAITSLMPNGDWDARFFWNVKAKFYLRVPDLWTGMFSPVMAWSHPDYPLLIPGAVAWGWNWAGREMMFWPSVVALTFALSLVLLIVWHLSVVRNWETGLLAGAFLMSIEYFRLWSASQYADVPVSFFFTAAALALYHALRLNSRALFALAGLMAGFACWTKNEGLFFTGWFLGAALLYRGARWWKDAERRKEILALGAGLMLPLLAVAVLKIFYGTTGDYLASERTPQDLMRLLFHSGHTQVILTGFWKYTFESAQWNGLWHFAVIAVFFNAFRTPAGKTRESWLPGLLSLCILAGYFVVIHVTPHPVVWQIRTALIRLLLHGAPLALVFAFEALSPASLDVRNLFKAAPASGAGKDPNRT